MTKSARFPTLLLLFAVYLAAAKVGLSFASVHPSASAIWPPTGIALAALLLLGRNVWPAIFAGAFLANITTYGSVATALGIATGNTLECVAGAWLVERFANGRRAFDRPPDIFRFAAFGLLAPMLSATVGVTTLSLAGEAAWANYATIWTTWWLGDAAGAILVAPVFLTWLTWNATSPAPRTRKDSLELAVVGGVLALSAAFVFGDLYAPLRNYPLAFVCIPALVWTAFRFGPRETSAANLLLAGVAIWSTIDGLGPFGSTPSNDRLLLVQAFMGTVATMAMSIAALVAEQQRLLAAAEAARADAEAANLAKDTFLAMLGHELRNPLAAIATAVPVLDRIIASQPKDERAEHILQVIGRQVNQLTRLVDDLLDVSRVIAGKIVLRRSRVDLGQLVTRSLEALSAAGGTDRHSVEVDRRTVWVDADETRLEQVVTNLVRNALKFTPPGGTIRVVVAEEPEWATLTVEDTGMGIAPSMLPRIFDLFMQEDRSPERTAGGLGIGLTLVKRLVELHEGRVQAASGGPGRGSRFTVRLPVASARRTGDVTHTPSSPSPPRRVLVVEDQADAREMLRMALQMAGHEVLEAADGLNGIDLAASAKPDVAVVDIGLPGCDGYEVARRVRKTADGKTILLVALTGYGQPEDRRRAEEAGFDLHLVKPVDPEQLNLLLRVHHDGAKS